MRIVGFGQDGDLNLTSVIIEDDCREYWFENPRWISVEERLPEEAESVLVRIRLCDATWYEVAHRINGRWSTTCITHWMPIPQPPKEE